jgi:hypothetical protein
METRSVFWQLARPGVSTDRQAMNKATIITAPNGERMAVIPLDEYERLVEAAEE